MNTETRTGHLSPQRFRIRLVVGVLVCGYGGADVTTTGEVCGSPPYVSPEQAASATDVTVASDVYGLGATLYHMITGRPPFQAASVAQTLRQVAETEPVPPRQLNPAVPRDLETICLKCLHKEPDRRYTSAQALADELDRYLADRPIQARPVTAMERAWRWTRRNPLVAGLLGLLLLTMTLGLVGVTTQWRRATGNLKIAQDRLRLAQDAVRELLLEVGQEELRDIPEMEPVRRALLQKALAYYERFMRHAAHDPHLRSDMSRARTSVGDIHQLLGLNEEAEQDYLRAIAQQKELIAEYPKDDEYRGELAISYSALLRQIYVNRA